MLIIASFNSAQQPGTKPEAPHLKLSGDIAKPLDLSAADFAKLPRTTVKTTNPHTQMQETYEGVQLRELLLRAEVASGEQVRGASMTTYIVAEASDGYRVIFSLAELEPSIGNAEVLVADKVDGSLLDEKHGPFQLVVPHDKRAARWVRMLKSLTVSTVGK